MALSRTQLAHLKDLIDRRYLALVAEIQMDVSRGRSDTLLSNDLAKEGGDAAERAAVKQMVRVDDAELSRDMDELNLIKAARSRLENRSFGQCADCQGDIAYERLQAQPWALCCLDCQRARESGTSMR